MVHIVPNSRNLPAEFSETRYPILIERLALHTDSGGPGYRRGGFGYDKRVRCLGETMLISNGDRSLINTYGVNGGKPGATYGITVHYPDGTEEAIPGMADNIRLPAGTGIRIRTTGGGGWGDPLAREPEKVAYDVECGLVSEDCARSEYGMVLRRNGAGVRVDAEATERLRRKMRAEYPSLAMFDRGRYFEEMKSRGLIAWPEDWADPDTGWVAREAVP